MRSGFALERMDIGPEDLRKSRLVAGSAVARLDNKTAVAFGFADGAKAMERRLTGALARRFPGRQRRRRQSGFLAERNGSVALRHEFGGTGVTVSGETGNVWQEFKTSATGSPYRWTSVAVDRRFGRNSAVGRPQPSRREADPARRPHERRARRRRREHPVPRCRGAARFRRRLERGADGAARLDQLRGGKFQTGAYALRPRQSRRASAAATSSACGSRSRCGSSMAASR